MDSAPVGGRGERQADLSVTRRKPFAYLLHSSATKTTPLGKLFLLRLLDGEEELIQ